MRLGLLKESPFHCVRHDFVLDEKGHECRRCGVREEIIHGQKFVLDPRMPEGEIHLVQDGRIVGRIVNVL